LTEKCFKKEARVINPDGSIDGHIMFPIHVLLMELFGDGIEIDLQSKTNENRLTSKNRPRKAKINIELLQMPQRWNFK
jgi:hypothetical protein